MSDSLISIALIEPAVDSQCLITEIFSQIRASLPFLDAALNRAGYRTSVYCEELIDLDTRLTEIAGFQVVGISVTINTLERACEIAGKISRLGKPLIVFGGLPAPHFCRTLLEYGHLIIQGPGEVVLPELLSCLKRNDDIRTLPGLVFKDNPKDSFIPGSAIPAQGEIISTGPNTRYQDLPSRYDGIIGFGGMSEKRNLLGLPKPPLYSLFLSTGCINRCRFCMTDRQYRVRSVDNLLRDMRAILKKHRTLLPPRFMLVDDCAFGNPESLEKLLHGLTLMRKTRVFEIMMQFHLSPIIRDPGILDRMVKAGVKTLLLGMESVSEAALRDQAKDITPDKCSRVIELCRSKGILPYGYFMAGFRTDTPEAIEQTFDYIIRKGLVAQVLPMGVMEPELLDFPEDLGKVLPLKWTDTEMKSLDPASFGAAMKVSHRHPDISPWEMQRLLISGYDRIYSLKRLINIPGLREKIYHFFFCLAYGKWRKQLIKHLEFLKEENSDALCHN